MRKNKRKLIFDDVRKFGRIYLYKNIKPIDERHGPEPLESNFTSESLFRLIKSKKSFSLSTPNRLIIVFQGVDTNQAIIKLHRGKATSSPSSTHAGEERRFDEDGNLYTLKEFIEFYGGDEEFRNSKTLFQVQAELELLAVNDALTTRSMRDHRERMFQSTSEITTPVAVGVATAAVVGTVATAAVAACAGALTGTVGAGVVSKIIE